MTAVYLDSTIGDQSSVPNTSGHTRFNIDFRVVHLDDVLALGGAPNVDSHCPGSTMNDYLRCADLAHLPREVTAPYDASPPQPVRGRQRP